MHVYILDKSELGAGTWVPNFHYTLSPPRPNQIRWNRGNESLPERAEAVGETLTLPGLVSADNGTYTCEASNKHGHARALYVLVVYGEGRAAGRAQGGGGAPGGGGWAWAKRPRNSGVRQPTEFLSFWDQTGPRGSNSGWPHSIADNRTCLRLS